MLGLLILETKREKAACPGGDGQIWEGFWASTPASCMTFIFLWSTGLRLIFLICAVGLVIKGFNEAIHNNTVGCSSLIKRSDPRQDPPGAMMFRTKTSTSQYIPPSMYDHSRQIKLAMSTWRFVFPISVWWVSRVIKSQDYDSRSCTDGPFSKGRELPRCYDHIPQEPSNHFVWQLKIHFKYLILESMKMYIDMYIIYKCVCALAVSFE